MAAPETRIMIGLATAGVVMAVHQQGMPTGADVRASESDELIESVRKQNLWLSAGIVSGIFLLTKDSVVFMMGGAMVVGLDWISRANIYANPVDNAINANPFNVSFRERESEAAVRNDAGDTTMYAVA